MTDREDIDVREREIRRRWHQAHVERFYAEADKGEGPWRDRNIAPHADEARPFLDALSRTRDLSAFQAGTDKWVRSFESGYAGTAKADDHQPDQQDVARSGRSRHHPARRPLDAR